MKFAWVSAITMNICGWISLADDERILAGTLFVGCIIVVSMIKAIEDITSEQS